MKIDRSNYGALIIDLLDGNLSQQEVDSLLDFLNENPDLKEELEMIKDFNLEPNNASFNAKSELKKSEILANEGSYFDELCITSVENNLTTEEDAYLKNEISNNPELQKKFDSYHMLKLEPDNSIIFKDKRSLRNPKKFFTPKRLFFTISSSIIAILAIFGLLLLNSNNKLNKTISELEKNRIENVHAEELPSKNINADIDESETPLVLKEKIEPVKAVEKNIVPVRKEGVVIKRNSVKPIVSSKLEQKDTKVSNDELYAKLNKVSANFNTEYFEILKSRKLSLSDSTITTSYILSQNLIPNASFEKPIEIFFSETDSSWQKYLKDDTPDYFNFSNENKVNDVFDKYIGGIYPKDGHAFMGLFCYRTSVEKKFKNIREYIKTPLLKTLEKDSTYRFEISICLDAESNVAIKNFGILFTNKTQEYNKYKLFNSEPQIVFNSTFLSSTSNWITLSCTYKAQGNENYIILGNFSDDNNTQIQIIDNQIESKKKDKWKLLKNEMASYYYIDNLILVKD